MTNTCRILLTTKCNFDCSYCCNKLPEVSSKFCSIKPEHLRNIKHRYTTFNLTGGEIGLIKPLVRETIEFLRCNNHEAKFYLYTNGLLDVDIPIASRISGINLGCHDNLEYVLARANYYSKFMDRSKIRIHIEDEKHFILKPKYLEKLNEYGTKIWTRNKCETNEDIFLLHC